MNIFGKSDIGMVRDTNQDSFRTVQLDKLYLCVVCDGMGGAAGGSTASAVACDEFVYAVTHKIDESNDKNTYEQILRESVNAANEKVYSMSTQSEELSGMGTTLCAVLTDGRKCWAVSVGDSRLYMFAGGKVSQISHDHSYVQALVDSGAITVDESKNHPNKNIITRAVGTGESVDCDSFVMDFDMDGLLICSDGLTNYMSDAELNSVFLQYNEPKDIVASYINGANTGGGGDNITVIIIKK